MEEGQEREKEISCDRRKRRRGGVRKGIKDVKEEEKEVKRKKEKRQRGGGEKELRT